MPWKTESLMSLRLEFIKFAVSKASPIRGLCDRFGISAKTGYKWIRRYQEQGETGLQDRSRRPHRSPRQTEDRLEQAVLSVRAAHPAWGGRKIRARLLALGIPKVPAASTITAILKRHHRIAPSESMKRKAWQRFEHASPNLLWQMDFKGHFPLARCRCHPLTVLDDHSRFSLCLQACGDERGPTVREKLISVFRLYGLPHALLMDNGSPWGLDAETPFTQFTVWLLRLGIRVVHSRAYHPQTQGKEERFHRTLKAEVLRNQVFRDLAHCQRHFDAWRQVYNLERPHEALGMDTPAQRYHPSPREFPETLPPIEYAPGDSVRRVCDKGIISFRGHTFRIGKAFRGHPVAIRPTVEDGVMEVYFCQQKVAQIDWNHPK